MTQHDNWQPEVARLAQRQDQLERQQRETSTRVDSLKMDVDTLKRDVDRSSESVRRDIESQFRDREWRVKSLERFRDSIENLILYGSMIACGIALFALFIIIIVDARNERRERAEPEERPLSSMKVPPVYQGQPNFLLVGQISTVPVAPIAALRGSSTGRLIPGLVQVPASTMGLLPAQKRCRFQPRPKA